MKKTNDYKGYLKSPEWLELRKKQLRNQKVCQACGTEKRLNVHHMTYRRLGNEKLKNLKTLCKECHFELHRAFKVVRLAEGFKKDDLIVFTHRFCKEKKKSLPCG